jgi:hypothetical protein
MWVRYGVKQGHDTRANYIAVSMLRATSFFGELGVRAEYDKIET